MFLGDRFLAQELNWNVSWCSLFRNILQVVGFSPNLPHSSKWSHYGHALFLLEICFQPTVGQNSVVENEKESSTQTQFKCYFQGIQRGVFLTCFHHIADIDIDLSPISRSYLVSIVCIGLAHQRSPKVKTKPAILLMMSMVNFDDYKVYISLLLERWKLKITCFLSFSYFTRLFVMLCKRRQCFNSFPVTEMLQKPDLHQVNVNNNAFALSWMH